MQNLKKYDIICTYKWGGYMRTNVEDLRLSFNSLYEEIKRKEIKDSKTNKPMFYIAKGNMYLGLYDRKQKKIVEELKKRKTSLSLENDQISPYFDRIHWEMSILVFTKLLKRIDEKTEKSGRINANASYFIEFARDMAAHYKEAFKELTGRTPYQDLLILIDGSEREKQSRKEYEEKVHEFLVQSYKKNFDGTKYAKENPFDCKEERKITNVKVNPNIPSKTKTTKEVVGVMVSLFGDEELEITVKRRTPSSK